jgi:hypothetical protein
VDIIYKSTGLPVVRIGLGPALSRKKYLYDINTLFFQDDYLQLILNCEYYICNPSGPHIIAAFIEKKTLIIDSATPLANLINFNAIPSSMIHIREQETQPSCSDVLIKAFSSFINTINEQRAP